MSFEEIHSERLDESYFKTVLNNGLTVYVYPMPEKTGVFAMLNAKIGSVTRDFMLDNRRVRVPAGVAHFLEHKLFEGEDGDAFSLFAQTGANANAYTTFDRTCYLFSATINVEESLRTLIRFVTSPYFTKETVEKEQGIIAQEIKMYDDDPDWVMMTMMLANLYVDHPIRDDIAGTVESIAEITPQTLYDCYNAFYRPTNMVLTIAGNMDAKQVEAICEEEYSCVNVPSETVSPILPQEPRHVSRPYNEKTMDIFEQVFALGYKEAPLSKETELRDLLALQILLELLAGETSTLSRRMYDEGLVNGMISASALLGDGLLCVSFSGESSDPQTAIEEIRKEIKLQRKEGLDAERFEECKRAVIGEELCSFDSLDRIARKMTTAYFKDICVYDILDAAEKISLEDVRRMLDQTMKEEYSTVAIIKPQEEGEE